MATAKTPAVVAKKAPTKPVPAKKVAAKPTAKTVKATPAKPIKTTPAKPTKVAKTNGKVETSSVVETNGAKRGRKRGGTDLGRPRSVRLTDNEWVELKKRGTTWLRGQLASGATT